jgi:branched-chain amino acid transport system substrate-binding protein
MSRSTRSRVGVVVASLAAVVAASGIAAGNAGAQAKSDPGVTGKSVRLGYIWSGTGSVASTFKNAGKACQARIDRANAAGGVNGRKIEVEMIDDKSSAANQTAAKDLVENRDVFAVVNNSSFAFLSYRYLLDQKVPMIGGGYDGSYYGQKGNEDILSALGNVAPATGMTYDTSARVMKKLGATKSAALAYGASASSSQAAKALQDYGMKGQGLDPVYTNTTVELGTADVGPLVLGIKNSGADAVFLPMVAETNIAVVQGLQQNGVPMKANILATGYGQALLDSPAAKAWQPNTLVFQTYKPVELKDAATKRFQADLKKVGLTGVPDYGTYTGYITCDLAVTALEHAGKNLTRRNFIDNFRAMGTYDAAGLNCQPYRVGLDTFGKVGPEVCSYYMQIKDGKFVVINKGKPFIGKLVGDPALIAQYEVGSKSTSTATSKPPTS